MYYIYLKQTGEYVGKTLQPLSSVLLSLYGYTNIEPPNYDKYQIPVYVEELNEWKLKPDYRGKWWNKQTKELVIIEEVGIIVDLEKYTDKEPCDYCVWSEENNDWIFDLELYKKAVIKKLLSEFEQYLLSKEPYLRQFALNTIVLRAFVLLNTNKSLLPEQIDTLANYIEECDTVFKWISSVVEYEDNIEKQILSATTKNEIDDIMSKVDFSQFDETYTYVTVADKLAYISKISLTDSESNE